MLCSVKKRAAKMRRGSRSVVQSAVPGRVVGLSAERKMPTSPMLQQRLLLLLMLLWCIAATAACPKMPVAVWHCKGQRTHDTRRMRRVMRSTSSLCRAKCNYERSLHGNARPTGITERERETDPETDGQLDRHV